MSVFFKAKSALKAIFPPINNAGGSVLSSGWRPMSKWPNRTREEATNGDKEAGVSLCSAEGLGVFTDHRKI